ncbi:DUF4397 domain-containing protein [Algoriphagus aestuarii]|nr:DUF4397 domain-containing protein [Algoriphagus aestuarii]
MFKRVKNWSAKNLKSLVALALIGATIGLTSCFNDDDLNQMPQGAYVLIYQGSPDAPLMDVYANQNKVNDFPLDYSEGISYSPFYTGDRLFKFTSTNSLSSLLEKNFTLKIDSVYSLFVVNKVAQLDAVIVQDNWEDPTADEAQLRLVNLSPDAGNVELEISEMENSLVDNLEFGKASEFEAVSPKVYTLTVKSKSSGETLVTASNIELLGNRVYTLILRGLEESNSQDDKLDLQLITNYINY